MLLYNIFQTDLVHNIHTASLAMYADDHQVYSSGDRIEDVESILNNQGRCISKWYQENLLKCNQEKFQVMSLGPRHKKKEMNIDIIDNRINSSSVIHPLGVSMMN